MNHLSLAFNEVRTSNAAINSVLRNTYFLLSICLISCAVATYLSVISQARPFFIITLIGTYGLLYLVHKNAESGLGILFSIAFSAFLGYTLGPIIGYSLSLPAGAFILFSSIGTTGLVFLSLSAYVLQTKQDFSFMNGMIFVGFMVVFAAMLLNLLFGGIPSLYLVLSAFVAMLSSASILLHTSMIINGGERNYILATVSLFVSLYNLFLSILQILMFFSGSNRE